MLEDVLTDIDVGGAQTEALVRSAVPMVRLLARRYGRDGIDPADLEAEGMLGLVLAARRYDPSRGVSFTSYARWWAKAMILRHVEKNSIPVSLGGTRATRALCQGLGKERRRLQSLGRSADTATLARTFGVSPTDIDDIDLARGGLRLPLHDSDPDNMQRPLEERLASDDEPTPEDEVIAAERARLVHAWMTRFERQLASERDRTLWRERLVAEDPVTLAELGRRYGVSRQRMAQVEQALLARLSAHADRQAPPTG